MHGFSVTGLKRMSISVHPRAVRKFVDVTSESGLPGLNGLGTESALDGLNGINGLGTESDQEHWGNKPL